MIFNEAPKSSASFFCDIPTIHQAFYWLRKNYGYVHFVSDMNVFEGDTIASRYTFYLWKINSLFTKDDESLLGYTSYQEAELKCLEKMLEIILENKTKQI